MKLAILGPAFSGKTTVFNALTGANEELSDFSGAGKEHRRDVHVPDPRLDRLADDFKPKKQNSLYFPYEFPDYFCSGCRNSGCNRIKSG